MLKANLRSPNRAVTLLALIMCLPPARSALAADSPEHSAAAVGPDPAEGMAPPPDLPTQNTVVNLINRLASKGILSKKDLNELTLLAEADAADARAQAAMTQAALAQAAASEARARAYAAMAGVRSAPSPQASISQSDIAALIAANRAANSGYAPAPDAVYAQTGVQQTVTDVPAQAVPAPRRVPVPAVEKPAAPPPEPIVPEDTVRVTYVPDVVKEQIRQEVKQDVLDEAHEEGWATPGAVPDWITRFRLFGDLRMRFEGDFYPSGNDDTGAFPNFNAINTGAPFDTAGGIFSPQINVDQDRERFRIRARLGSEIDLGQNFSVGMRAATGSDNSPVTENQTLGYAGSGQGGDFSKYSLWLDRAFVKYEVGGAPDEDLSFFAGRFDNPFMTTSMVWANDIGFDGFAVKGKYGLGETVTPFLTLGAFPVFDTDLNFATNNPAKFKSYDKWLDAAQLGANFDFGKDFAAQLGLAYYYYRNIEGKLSDPFTPLNSSQAGDTDASRPSFAQFGNSYMPIRDILADADNQNGQIDQFQYYGLATKFHELAVDTKLDFNAFLPFQVSLKAEYVKNLAFDNRAISALAINNRIGSASSTATQFDGGPTGWYTMLTFGDAAIENRWDWNVYLGYRKVESDSVVDGFADSDFGLGGTNFKGETIGGSLALANSVWLDLRWMPATTIAGPAYKINIVQFDLNTRF